MAGAEAHPPRAPRHRLPPSIEEFRIVAQAVVEHLELNGYELRHDARPVPHSHKGDDSG